MLAPKQGGHKYCNYAEFLDSWEAVRMFEQGIEVLRLDHEA